MPTRLQNTLVDSTTDYARAVVSGGIIAGPYVRAACQRHLTDLQTGHERGIKFDVAKAEHVIEFFPTLLCLPDGEGAGTPFNLDPHQKFIIGSIFGWLNDEGHRRFRIAYIEEGKGNGKSPLAAGVGIYCTLADGEPGAEVYAAATQKDQAQIMFQDAVKMRAASPALKDRLHTAGINPVYNLADLKSGSYFRPVSAEGRGLDGKRVHCAIIDEVHEHPNDQVVEKMRAGTKGRRQGLIFMITNSGVDRNSIGWQWHEFGTRALKGESEMLESDHCFFYICALDAEDDWTDEATWIKANPNLGVSITLRYLREQVREALGMPSKQNIVKRLNFCEWTDAFSAWISVTTRERAFAEMNVADYAGARCYGGLDLSMARDLTAFSLCFPKGEHRYDLITFFWTPGDNARERGNIDRVPYELWIEQGHLIATPGMVVNYDFVADAICDALRDYDLADIAVDPYRLETLNAHLELRGVIAPLVRHPQGFMKRDNSRLWLPASINELEAGMIEGRAKLQKNPVMAWNLASVVLESDAAGNRKFAKNKATGRIDGCVAAAMALGIAADAEIAARSIYDKMAASEPTNGDLGPNNLGLAAHPRAEISQ
jgi:phage terminase large subunit-like protein